MNLRRISRLAIAVAAMLTPALCEAGLVTNVSSTNNAVAQVTAVSGISHTAGSPSNSGTITVDLEVFQLHTPIELTFTYGTGGADGFTDYAVTLNVKNSITNLGDSLNFNGFDLTRSATATGAVLSSGARQTIAPTSNVFAVEYSGVFNITNGFRWGGLNGGGPRLAPGGTAINTFVYRVTWDGTNGGGTSALRFVANPEPATLLLGSLLMAPAAWVARRRRQGNAVSKEECAI